MVLLSTDVAKGREERKNAGGRSPQSSLLRIREKGWKEKGREGRKEDAVSKGGCLFRHVISKKKVARTFVFTCRGAA